MCFIAWRDARYHLFSPAPVADWAARCGFHAIEVVDVTTTTVEEQRQTDWMHFESLADYPDPANPQLTVEDHPAPRRAIIIARTG